MIENKKEASKWKKGVEKGANAGNSHFNTEFGINKHYMISVVVKSDIQTFDSRDDTNEIFVCSLQSSIDLMALY